MKVQPMHRIVVMLAVALSASCSKQPPPDAATPVHDAPLVTAPSAPASAPAQTLKGELTTGGTSVSYEASFAGGQLARISEIRGTPDPARNGEYDFYGARLLHYKGAALSDGAAIELEFNMNGALTATHAARAVTAEEVAAIRTRADLLRNHALAQQSVRSHRTQ
jgi:hypothetical protein